MIDSIEKIFGPDGILATHLDGFEPRPGQEEMARAVAEVLDFPDEFDTPPGERAECLVVEAETGLGKTLAYLVPAVLSGRRVVVSTNTRNLQDQILKHEIPFIRQYIDPSLKALCVKGRQNYLCLYRWHQLRSAAQGELFTNERADRINEWLSATIFADRAELDWLPGNSPLWQKICCQSHFCLGSDCPDGPACFLNRLRREAASSRILVVNHHLLFSDLAVRRSGYGEVLPRYEAVIFDEAHHVENVATTFFGLSFSRYQVLDLVADVERSAQSGLGGRHRDQILQQARSLDGLTHQFTDAFPPERGRFPLQQLLENRPELLSLRDTLVDGLRRLGKALENLGSGDEPWEQYGQRAADLASRLEQILSTEPADSEEDTRFVLWFERTEKNLTLSATPVDVARDLQSTLFTSVSGCIFTSATLSTGNSFGYFKKRLGLPEDTPSLSFPSPFDYRNRTLLYIPPKGFPEPAAPGYTEALHEQLRELLTLSRGRALVLFTSYQAMEQAWHSLQNTLEYPLLRQGTAPRHELLTRFGEERSSVLLGVSSFWEGVNIPGESLSLLVIDKLPFEVPSDPVIMARINRIKDNGGNPFFEFQVPRAILGLRQGVGRLMRTGRDRGVMAILDIRLYTKGYGRKFLKSLPPAPICRDLKEVEDFFADRQDGA
ncbi:ATP-dependent DNA helicase [Desulfolithobacter dissulfuricans]|nr:ATP-dependent DNA helicase [Desulfolithobacter dissulfuricans]